MRLTLHTDYAFRALIYLANAGERGGTTVAVANAYGISHNHLVKVMQRLRTLGYVDATRGRSGGMRLAVPPARIGLGEVVRATEDNLDLVECFNPATNSCPLIEACSLKLKLGEALAAYLSVLDRYTIADVMGDRSRMLAILGPFTPAC